LSHQEAIERNLKVMDTTASRLPGESYAYIVFSIREKGAIAACCAEKGAPPSSAREALSPSRRRKRSMEID